MKKILLIAALAAGFGAVSPTNIAEAAAGKNMLAAAGAGFSCVISSGALYCWGLNDRGQVGLGTISTSPNYVALPTLVPGFGSGVTAVTAGLEHMCALMGGQVWCWGQNINGQLGDNTVINRSSPTLVAGLTGVVDISAGVQHTCALNDVQASGVGQISCWGGNGFGALGDGTLVDHHTPVVIKIPGIFDPHQFTRVSAGGLHNCGLVLHRLSE